MANWWFLVSAIWHGAFHASFEPPWKLQRSKRFRDGTAGGRRLPDRDSLFLSGSSSHSVVCSGYCLLVCLLERNHAGPLDFD